MPRSRRPRPARLARLAAVTALPVAAVLTASGAAPAASAVAAPGTTIDITSPADGGAVRAPVTLAATARADVSRVDFLLRGRGQFGFTGINVFAGSSTGPGTFTTTVQGPLGTFGVTPFVLARGYAGSRVVEDEVEAQYLEDVDRISYTDGPGKIARLTGGARTFANIYVTLPAPGATAGFDVSVPTTGTYDLLVGTVQYADVPEASIITTPDVASRGTVRASVDGQPVGTVQFDTPLQTPERTVTVRTIRTQLAAGTRRVEFRNTGGSSSISLFEVLRPVAPVSASLPVTVQAEDFTRNPQDTVVRGAGAAPGTVGRGSVRFTGPLGGAAGTVTVPDQGTYTVTIRYIAPQRNSTVYVFANGRDVELVGLPRTRTWSTVSLRVPLARGQNTLGFTTPFVSGSSLDQVTVDR